jgi:MFS family permease
MALARTNRWVTLGALVIGTLGAGLTIAITTLGAEEIALDLDASVALVTWGVTGAILGSVIGSSILGKVADVYGRRLVYLLCMSALVALLPLTALAENGWQFISLRVLAGVGTGGASSAAAALLYQTFPGEDRARAIGIFTAVMTGAPAIGIIISGPAIDTIGWQALFIILGALAAGALTIGVLVLPTAARSERYPIDFAGGMVGASAIAMLLIAVTVGAQDGWAAPLTLTLIAGGVLALAGFVLIERRASHPLVRLDYLQRRNFILPTLVSTTNSFAYMGGLVVSPILLVSRFGYSISSAAGVLFVRPAMYSIFSAVGGFLLPRIGGRRILLGSATALSAALGLMAVAAMQTSLPLLVLSLLLAGAGAGSASSSVATLTADASDPADYGMATGMRSVLIQVGVTAGIQTLTVVLGDGRAGEDFVLPFLLASGVAAIGVVLATFVRADSAGSANVTA